MKKLLLLAFMVALLFLIAACLPPAESDDPFDEQEALAGQVVSTGCRTYSGSCTESDNGHTVSFTYFDRTYTKSDQCSATYVYDWSCPSSTQFQYCTSPSCGEGLECVNNYCVSVAAPVVEICDNLDNDADGLFDEGCDDDNDNYCDASMTVSGTPTTCTVGGGDCDDVANYISPGRTEVCFDSIDNNCNGIVNENCISCTDSDGGPVINIAGACYSPPDGSPAYCTFGEGAVCVSEEDICVNFEARVAEINDPNSLLDGAISSGNILNGHYIYDRCVSGNHGTHTYSDTWVGQYAQYSYTPPPYGIFINANELRFETDPTQNDPLNFNFLIEIHNDDPNDVYLVRSYHNKPVSSGVLTDHISWELNDITDAVLSDDSLPLTPPVLSAWGFGDDFLTITGSREGAPDDEYLIRASITSVGGCVE